jgi:hypothetical protein
VSAVATAPSATRAALDVEIVAVERIVLDLPAKAVFMLAGGLMSHPGAPAPRVLTRVTGSNGVVGWGESTPSPTWSYETVETIYWTSKRYLARVAVGWPAWDLDGLNRAFDRAIMPGISIGQPIARAGVDEAVHDLLARSLDVLLYRLLGGKRKDTIELGWIVSSDRSDAGAELAREGLEKGFRAFKVKIGIHGEKDDVAMGGRGAPGDRARRFLVGRCEPGLLRRSGDPCGAPTGGIGSRCVRATAASQRHQRVAPPDGKDRYPGGPRRVAALAVGPGAVRQAGCRRGGDCQGPAQRRAVELSTICGAGRGQRCAADGAAV